MRNGSLHNVSKPYCVQFRLDESNFDSKGRETNTINRERSQTCNNGIKKKQERLEMQEERDRQTAKEEARKTAARNKRHRQERIAILY